jgi:hypothetical protein
MSNKKIFYLVQKGTTNYITCKKGFSWSLFFASWSGFPFFTRRMFKTGILVTIFFLVYAINTYFYIKGYIEHFKTIKLEGNESVEAIKQAVHFESFFSKMQSWLDIIALAISIIAGAFADKFITKRLCRKGDWTISAEDPQTLEKVKKWI